MATGAIQRRKPLDQAAPLDRRYVTMHIDSHYLIAAALLVIVSHAVLLRSLVTARRRLALVESEHQQAERDLLRCRTEHAREAADMKAEHAKVVAALQGNVKDLSALHKEKAHPAWDRPKEPNVTTLAPRSPKRYMT